MTHGNGKMGFNAAWCMAVGGMVGGGIFATLGLVIEMAGAYAWAAYVTGGIAALITGLSYHALTKYFHESGGVYTFLRKENMPKIAGDVAWLLIISYVLTISVYAFTFGHYVHYLISESYGVIARLTAAGIIIILTAINLRGVAGSAWLEIISVWGKCIILLGLSLFGLLHFVPETLHYDEVNYHPVLGIGIGAAVVFMAYEGFQLLAYDYDDIKNPDRTMLWAIVTAIIFVIILYIVITLGTSSLVGTEIIVRDKEIALAKAGQVAFGTSGKIIMAIAAVFSTASAINSTLFATARLAKVVSEDKELPVFFAKENTHKVPSRALMMIGGGAIVLAVLGNLGVLVEGASLLFLLIFAIVNGLAAKQRTSYASLKWAGCGLCLILAVLDIYYLATNHLFMLGAMVLIIGFIVLFRHQIMQKYKAKIC